MSQIKLEILQYSYWEHYKRAKDLALVLPLEHSTRQEIEQELNRLIVEINNIKKNEPKAKRGT